MSWLSKDLPLHPRSRRQIAGLMQSPRNCYLFIAKPNQGSQEVEQAATIHWKAQRLQEIDLRLKGGGMDEVREVRRRLQTSSAQRRIISIQAANKLSHEAQNALLKTLEDTPQNTTFILHSSTDRGILPTIKSRSDIINLLPLGVNQFTEFLMNAVPELTTDIARRIYYMNSGVYDTTLNNSDRISEYSSQFDSAKSFLVSDQLERFATIDSVLKQDAALAGFLSNLAATIRAAQSTSAQAGNIKAAKTWAKKLLFTEEILSGYEKNANKKLLMANLVVNL